MSEESTSGVSDPTAIHPERWTGWSRRAVPAPDRELTQVGPDTPCGEYLRTAWQPICLSAQLADLPLAIRILGEDLVAFRDKSGRVGVLHRHCSHRGASLEFGVIEDCGISCCYHGWHFDIDGTILATPAEPPTTRIRTQIRHGAYPAIEIAGLVFGYFGDPAHLPPPPAFDVAEDPRVTLAPFVVSIPCNWLQVYENSQDPVHVVWLHTRIAGAHFDPSNAAEQELDFVETPLGMINVQTRRWGDALWTRTVECILPNANQTGAIWEAADTEKVFQRVGLTRWIVPIDDETTLQIGWRHLGAHLDPAGKDRPDEIGVGRIDFEGQDDSAPYEARQRRPGDYDAQVSQRRIAVHALENLVRSDRGVVMLRWLIRRGIRALPQGARPAATQRSRLATYAQDTVSLIADRGEEDAALRRAHGAAVAAAVLTDADRPAEVRAATIRAAVARLRRGGDDTSRSTAIDEAAR